MLSLSCSNLEDFDALFDRINQAYPDQFAWMSKVGDEPIETFRLLQENKSLVGA